MKHDRKTFLIDTSVLLYDKTAIHSFPENDVIIPLVVLDELDRFKEKPGIIGESARYVNRFLDDLRSSGNLHEGISIDNDQTIRVEINHSKKIPSGLDPSSSDNRIIGVASELSSIENSKVIVITKDINFRVKCDALGIMSEDYYKDRVVSSESQIYSGQIQIEASDNFVSSFHKNKGIDRSALEEFYDGNIYPNQFVIGKSASGSASFLGKVIEDRIVPVSCDLADLIDVKPRNKEQKFALDLLTRRDLPLVTMTGIAGSGKTFLTIMAAMSALSQKKCERIVITRSMQTVGKDIGYLPGTVKEKMDPWISPISDNFRHAFKDTAYFELMREKGQIEVAPLSFIRGRTFNDAFIIVDESQNSTIHELKTLITRVGEGSKIVLLGDIEQIDTPYIDSLSNGLTIVTEKFKSADIAGHITLLKGERSKLATLASKII
jgi:PhoH-like ATPase